MFEEAGFTVEDMGHWPFPRKEQLAYALTLGLARDFLVKQYIVKARKLRD
jgi:hypothetical protein